MDVWLLAIYAVASLLAVRSLISLMSHHQVYYRQERLARIRGTGKTKRQAGKNHAEQETSPAAGSKQRAA